MRSKCNTPREETIEGSVIGAEDDHSEVTEEASNRGAASEGKGDSSEGIDLVAASTAVRRDT